jgi:hypothetical protein
MMSYNDLNESSRLDLNYDPNVGNSNDDDDASQQYYLTNIDEDESSETSVGDDDVPTNGTAVNGVGHTVVENGLNTSASTNITSLSREGSSNTFALARSTSDRCAAGSVCRKLVSMRLRDSGQIVTIELDASTNNHGIDETQRLIPDVGTNLTLRHDGDNDVILDGDGINLTMGWQPPLIIWEPPLIISARNVMQLYDEGNIVAVTTNANSGRVTREQSQVASIPQTQERLSVPEKGLEPFIIPSILSLKVIKHNPTDAVGISFTKTNGTIVIDTITPASLFAGTDLLPGYQCLSINGHRIRSANRAAEIVRDSKTSLRLIASNTSHCPLGTMYTMISLKKNSRSSSMPDMKKTTPTATGHSMNDFSTANEECAAGMYFKMKHGLVQLVKFDSDSPIKTTSMKVGDYILAINGIAVGSISRTVRALSKSNHDIVPILYFSMTRLRVSISDEVMDKNLWTKEWSSDYKTCVISQINDLSDKTSSNPITIQFTDNRCELLDNIVPSDHHLISVVETLNNSMSLAFSTIYEGVKLATKRRSSSKRASA